MKRIQVLALLLAALFLIGIAWSLRPKPHLQKDTPSSPAPRLKATPESRAAEGAQDEVPISREPSPRQARTFPLADPSALRNEQIARVQFDGVRYRIWLTDGRRYELPPSQIDQLPSEVRAKFRYRRGRGRP